jgi:hypothetical protein
MSFSEVSEALIKDAVLYPVRPATNFLYQALHTLPLLFAFVRMANKKVG